MESGEKQQTRKEHAMRLRRIEFLADYMGLNVVKEDKQVKRIQVFQGKVLLYSEWNLHRGDAVTIAMNRNLENYLMKYWGNLKEFGGLNFSIVVDRMLEELGGK